MLAYEDFNGSLSLAWKIARPDQSRISLSKNPGTLTITTQSGDMLSHYRDYENLLLMDCPAGPGEDFRLTTCISSFAPTADWNQAGLTCHNGDNDYLAFTFAWNSFHGGTVFCVRVEEARRPNHTNFYSLQNSERLWLRVTKRGNRYTFSMSYDGKTFLPRNHPENEGMGRFQGGIAWGDGTVRHVGLLAINGSGSAAPEIDASFDFFEVCSIDGETE
jgi:hypothetical protein